MLYEIDPTSWLGPYEYQMVLNLFFWTFLRNFIIIGSCVALSNTIVYMRTKTIITLSTKSVLLSLFAILIFLASIYCIAYRNKEYNNVSKFYREYASYLEEDICLFVRNPQTSECEIILAILLLAYNDNNILIKDLKYNHETICSSENIRLVFEFSERYMNNNKINHQEIKLPYWSKSRLEEAMFHAVYRSFKIYKDTGDRNNRGRP